MRAEPGRQRGPGARPHRRPHFDPRVQVPQQRDRRERERARAVDEDRPATRRRRQQQRPQRHADRIRQHRRLVRDTRRNGKQLRGVRGEPLRVRPGSRRAVPDVNRDGQVTRAEVPAPRVPAGQAGRARRVDAAGHAGEPGVEHHPFVRIRPPPDHLVPEHVRKRHQRGERVVAGPVEQDLLHVGAAQPREGRLHPDPVRGGQRELFHVLDPDRREAGDERPAVHAAAHGRSRLPGQVVPEDQRPHRPGP